MEGYRLGSRLALIPLLMRPSLDAAPTADGDIVRCPFLFPLPMSAYLVTDGHIFARQTSLSLNGIIAAADNPLIIRCLLVVSGMFKH